MIEGLFPFAIKICAVLSREENTNVMRTTKSIALIAGMMWLTWAIASTAGAQTQAALPKTPEALVADLYQAQKSKRGPFFQTRSRALVDKYFSKSLGDLIWKDARTSKGEVGVIDGDPLYDAQDMQIKKFVIGKYVSETTGKAKVPVTFENFGEKKTITFMLTKGTIGWRIDDIDYGGGRTLMSEFKTP
jgi:hypothetical protein